MSRVWPTKTVAAFVLFQHVVSHSFTLLKAMSASFRDSVTAWLSWSVIVKTREFLVTSIRHWRHFHNNLNKRLNNIVPRLSLLCLFCLGIAERAWEWSWHVTWLELIFKSSFFCFYWFSSRFLFSSRAQSGQTTKQTNSKLSLLIDFNLFPIALSLKVFFSFT